MMGFISKLKQRLSKKIEWSAPPKVKYIIYEEYNANVLLEYLDKNDTYILSANSINFGVFLRCILKGRFHYSDYFRAYIRATGARIVITSIDNDLFFFGLKQTMPEITTIMCQYAWHSELADIFSTLKHNPPSKKYFIDYMLLFNENIREKYLEYVDGDTIIIGSFKSNLIQYDIADIPEGKTLTYISQYRPKQSFHPVAFYDGGRAYYRDEFYHAETILLPLLYAYCKENRIKLQIAGHGVTKAEYEFFGEMIGNFNWEFVPRIGPYDSYKTVHRSQVVVGIDSALVYESFGRGKRTAIFPVRYIGLKAESYRFGWPGKYPGSGPFWSETASENEINRVLDFLFSATDTEWEQTQKQYADGIMQYDPGNTKLVNLVKSLDGQKKN